MQKCFSLYTKYMHSRPSNRKINFWTRQLNKTWKCLHWRRVDFKRFLTWRSHLVKYWPSRFQALVLVVDYQCVGFSRVPISHESDPQNVHKELSYTIQAASHQGELAYLLTSVHMSVIPDTRTGSRIRIAPQLDIELSLWSRPWVWHGSWTVWSTEHAEEDVSSINRPMIRPRPKSLEDPSRRHLKRWSVWQYYST